MENGIDKVAMHSRNHCVWVGLTQEADAMLPEQQAAQEDAVHLLLDTFCLAHAEGFSHFFIKYVNPIFTCGLVLID